MIRPPKSIPVNPDYVLASMGIYAFKDGVLIEALQEEGDGFGRDMIPAITGKRPDVAVYNFTERNRIEDFVIQAEDGRRNKILTDRTRDSSYWRDVGSIDSYYEASMDLVGVEPLFNLYTGKWVFRTYERTLPPSNCIIVGKHWSQMISDGCIISSGGLFQRSMLSPRVIVEEDALVDDSVIFDDVIIEPGAKIKRAIIDKETKIRAHALVGYDLEDDKRRGCTISDEGVGYLEEWT